MQAYLSRKHEDDKVIVFERAGLIFVFNFNPSESFTDYKIGVQVDGAYPCARSYMLICTALLNATAQYSNHFNVNPVYPILWYSQSRLFCSGGARAVNQPGHLEVGKSSSQVI